MPLKPYPPDDEPAREPPPSSWPDGAGRASPSPWEQLLAEMRRDYSPTGAAMGGSPTSAWSASATPTGNQAARRQSSPMPNDSKSAGFESPAHDARLADPDGSRAARPAGLESLAQLSEAAIGELSGLGRLLAARDRTDGHDWPPGPGPNELVDAALPVNQTADLAALGGDESLGDASLPLAAGSSWMGREPGTPAGPTIGPAQTTEPPEAVDESRAALVRELAAGAGAAASPNPPSLAPFAPAIGPLLSDQQPPATSMGPSQMFTGGVHPHDPTPARGEELALLLETAARDRRPGPTEAERRPMHRDPWDPRRDPQGDSQLRPTIESFADETFSAEAGDADDRDGGGRRWWARFDPADGRRPAQPGNYTTAAGPGRDTVEGASAVLGPGDDELLEKIQQVSVRQEELRNLLDQLVERPLEAVIAAG